MEKSERKFHSEQKTGLKHGNSAEQGQLSFYTRHPGDAGVFWLKLEKNQAIGEKNLPDF